nr:NTP transferase domain-containing protein [Candidatus Sigynarchaeota archaeon]
MMIHRAILAGGRSSRFGSNKAIFKHGDIALISTLILEMLKTRGNSSPIIVSVHNEMQEREIFSVIQTDLVSSIFKDDGSLLIKANQEHPAIPIIPILDPVD